MTLGARRGRLSYTMQLNELRKELRFNRELLSLVETLKNVAGAQYHVMEKEKERFDRFMESFAGFFRVVDLVDVASPLVKVESDVLGIVIVTSDSGFMGGLNQAVLRLALEQQAALPPDKVALVVIGEKGSGLLSDQRREFKFFPGIAQDKIYEHAVAVRDHLVAEVLARRMGRVIVVAPRALSFSSQTLDTTPILPCGALFDRNAASEVADRVGRMKILAEARRVIVESSYEDMVRYLSSLWVTSKLYEVFEDSKLAEFSARAMHLEGSQQKIEKTFKRVKHLCSKASHEQIDKGMRESFAAKSGKKKRLKRSSQAA